MKRRSGIAVALLMLITVAAGFVAAAPVAGQSGNRGTYALVDSATTPGVICVYPTPVTDDFIGKITIRAPRVWAFDRTTGTDTEWVGWRYRIDYTALGNPQPGDWHTLVTSTFSKAIATDKHRALWKDRSYAFHPYGLSGSYRVAIQIRWYHPGQITVDGKVSRLFTHYLDRSTGFPDQPFMSSTCEGNLG